MRLLWIVIQLTLPLCFAVSQGQEKEGEEKIRDTIKQIEEEAEEESEEETEDEYDDDSCSGCQLFFEIFLEIFEELFWDYAWAIRFADYPYAENSIYFHNASAFRYPRERKAVSLQAATDIATNFDGTYGNINRISVQLTTLHANFYNQIIFAGSEWLSATSLNAGTASLNYAIWRFSLGVGYNYSRFINSEYSGPSLKICFWL